MAAAAAVSTVRVTMRACSVAAPSLPSSMASRVLTRPGTGALARLATVPRSTVTGHIPVAARQAGRLRAEIIGQPQAPHQHDRAPDAMLLPAPTRGRDPVDEAQWWRQALERARQRDVLHQRDVRKAAGRQKRVAAYE